MNEGIDGPPPPLPELLARFRAAFERDAVETFRAWYRLQESLRDEGRGDEARALADDLWLLAATLDLPDPSVRARFFHNLAVFFGSRGPAASLSRSLEAFEVPLATWRTEEEPDDVARLHHNRGNALQSLGASREELAESVAMYENALSWRDASRRVARAVTLHHLGSALRRLAELDREGAIAHLSRSVQALEEAVSLRAADGLREGEALSLFQLGLTLDAGTAFGLSAPPDVARAFDRAAAAFEAAGKEAEGAVARRLADDRRR
ncbi:MAG TPA: hypothetical protein VGR00_01615 [Thermoanaerobaculia bacterium]|nr:hypothetical protein [Thermoanaerobaculia bacterium]